jgi:hypothetical protein
MTSISSVPAMQSRHWLEYLFCIARIYSNSSIFKEKIS